MILFVKFGLIMPKLPFLLLLVSAVYYNNNGLCGVLCFYKYLMSFSISHDTEVIETVLLFIDYFFVKPKPFRYVSSIRKKTLIY